MPSSPRSITAGGPFPGTRGPPAHPGRRRRGGPRPARARGRSEAPTGAKNEGASRGAAVSADPREQHRGGDASSGSRSKLAPEIDCLEARDEDAPWRTPGRRLDPLGGSRSHSRKPIVPSQLGRAPWSRIGRYREVVPVHEEVADHVGERTRQAIRSSSSTRPARWRGCATTAPPSTAG